LSYSPKLRQAVGFRCVSLPPRPTYRQRAIRRNWWA